MRPRLLWLGLLLLLLLRRRRRLLIASLLVLLLLRLLGLDLCLGVHVRQTALRLGAQVAAGGEGRRRHPRRPGRENGLHRSRSF